MTAEALHAAMTYAVMNGGKRLRPQLVLACGHALNAPLPALERPAAAIEYLHTYSLIHDDLPAMDNDDFRRGKPTCHRAFTEATAILAGDALQNLAFHIISAPTDQLTPPQQIQLIHTLTQANHAMVQGQSLDLQYEQTTPSLEAIEQLHLQKTGALLRAALTMPAIVANAPIATQQLLGLLGEQLGLAFQIQDDLLDITATFETLGKKTQQDAAHHKPTYPALVGQTAARERIHTLQTQITDILTTLELQQTPLSTLVQKILRRH